MKALVYHGPKQIAWQEHPKPALAKPSDALVKITHTTICGTDLAILKGGVATVQPGRVLGHEGVGIVEEVGNAVSAFKPGDKVLISCITACGKCAACKKGLFSNCADGGWILGNTIDGTQAEYVRIPHADNSLYHIPPALSEEAALMLSDIIPTGLEVGVLNGEVKFGDTVAIAGAGPVGLAVLLTAQFYSPAEIIVVDIDDNRLKIAQSLGATVTINNRDNTAAQQILAFTGGKGVDVAIEVVGSPITCKLCQTIIGSGGRIANVGIYADSVELHKHILWTRNVTIRMGVVNTHTIPLLVKTVTAGKLDPTRLITHHFPLDRILEAYDVFANAAREQAIKVVLTGDCAGAPDALSAALIEQIVKKVLQAKAQ